MNRIQFLSQAPVRSFVSWMQGRLDGEGGFAHRYEGGDGEMWHCSSLYDAHQKYRWSFRCQDPDSGQLRRGFSFGDTVSVISHLSSGLSEGLKAEDPKQCAKYCIAMLEWGKLLPYNRETILDMGNDIIPYLRRARRQLNLETYDTDDPPRLKMNSGFSKIYRLLVDGLVMYDSRVAAGLCLLIRCFCEANGLDEVPKVLDVYLPESRSKRQRDPSTQRYKFSSNYSYDRYLNSAVKASWLFSDILQGVQSSFGNYEEDIRLTALQSALFMIGYDVSSPLMPTQSRLEQPVELPEAELATNNDVHMVVVRRVPPVLLQAVCNTIGRLPFRTRGIRITRDLVKASMEILNAAPKNTLPQNCRNDVRKRTPDGLDRRIKEYLDTDLRTANIISDLLAEADVVEVIQVVNPHTGRKVLGTRLLRQWTW